jgi:hypothetical protein
VGYIPLSTLYASSLKGPMSFFRSYIAPLLIVLIFAIAMLAVSARIFLPSDMLAPAPIEEPSASTLTVPLPTPVSPAGADSLAPALSELIHGPGQLGLEG